MGERLADMVRKQADERPYAPALTGGDRTLSYVELDEHAERPRPLMEFSPRVIGYRLAWNGE